MSYRPRGVNPALVTPFDREERVDEEAFRLLIRSVLPHVDGLVPCGTTGEFVYLTPDERKRLYEIALEEAGDLPVIAGTGACSTREAVELTRFAHEAGASAALVVGPYYLKPSDKGFYQHFREVAQCCPIPILLYNIPQVTGSYIPRRVIEDLAGIENIVGLKDSSGNLTYTMEILDRVRNGIDVMIGHDEVVLPALAGGCSGMILASAQVFPDIWQKIYGAVAEGDLRTAGEWQLKVQKLARIYCRMGGSVPVKASLRMMGIPVGRARKPLFEGGSIIHEDLSEIRAELEKLGKVAPAKTGQEVSWIPLADRFRDIGMDRAAITGEGLPIATGSSGNGPEAVRVDMVAGEKEGIVGRTFAYQMTYPRHGYEALTAILEPNLSVRPSTLIIPAVRQKNLRQANMIFGPIQSSGAKAIADGVDNRLIPENILDDTVLLAVVHLGADAADRKRIFNNSYEAFSTAIRDIFAAGEGGG